MSDFYSVMSPYAARASKALNMDTGVILAQWADESAKGTSPLARAANNFAGINYSPNSIAIGSDGAFAKYSSNDQFTDDYIRVMSLSYYNAVRGAGSVSDTIKALGASPYAESKYDSNKSGVAGRDLNNIYYADNLGQYSSAPAGATGAPALSASTASLIAIGTAAVALFALLGSHNNS